MLNKVFIMGRLGADPELRRTQSGISVVSFRLAVDRDFKDKQTGESKERSEWHNVVFAGPVVATVEKYLEKGATVYIEGRLRTRKWQDKEGNDRYTTEVVARTFQFLDKKGSDGVPPGYAGEDDDIPY